MIGKGNLFTKSIQRIFYWDDGEPGKWYEPRVTGAWKTRNHEEIAAFEAGRI